MAARQTPWQLANPAGPAGRSYFYMVRHFVSVIWKPWYGKILMTIWTGYFVWLALWPPSFKANRVSKGKQQNTAAKSVPRRKKKSTDSLSRLIKLLFPAMRGYRGAMLGLYIAVLSTRVLITVKLADIGGRLGSLMGSRRWDMMFRNQAVFGLWYSIRLSMISDTTIATAGMAAAAATALMKYLEKRMALTVREILYHRFVRKYLSPDLLYYRLALGDTSARLTVDMMEFCNELTHTFGFIVKPIIDTSYLTVALTARLGLKSMLTLYGFIIIGSQSLARAKKLLPHSLKACAIEAQQLEAALRTSHGRLHSYREQIALQKGTIRERDNLLGQFAQVKRNQTEMLFSKGIIDLLNSYVMRYGGMMCAFSVLIEPVYRGRLAVADTETVTAGYLADMQLLQALAGAISDLEDSFVSVPRLRGLAERVYELEQAMRTISLPTRSIANFPDSDGLSVKGLTVRPPRPANTDDNSDQQPALFTGLQLEIRPGDHTVIRGPNGVGKTSLFRTLAGLWDGGTEATLHLPHSLFIVPQDCYFPLASLAEQMTYPNSAVEIDTDRAVSLLRRSGLDDWRREYGYDLDTVADWTAILSGGQKQRLSWCRLYYNLPKFALVDEGTSAVDRNSVDLLYQTAKDLGITLVSVSHHDAVDAHHKNALDLHPGGEWKFSRLVDSPRPPTGGSLPPKISEIDHLRSRLEGLSTAIATDSVIVSLLAKLETQLSDR